MENNSGSAAVAPAPECPYHGDSMYTYPVWRYDPRDGDDGVLWRVRAWKCAEWDCLHELTVDAGAFDEAKAASRA